MENRVEINELLGNLFAAIIVLGITGGILFFCWNHALHQVAPVGEIKYYQSFLLILGWRALTYKKE